MSKANVRVDCSAFFREVDEGKSADTSVKESSDDKCWERRCHNAEEQLQAIARELQRANEILNERESVIVSLEHENKLLSVQLDMVHLIFGSHR